MRRYMAARRYGARAGGESVLAREPACGEVRNANGAPVAGRPVPVIRTTSGGYFTTNGNFWPAA
jgi:hypothetical protein